MARAPVKVIGNGLIATGETLVGNGVLNNDGMMLDYDQAHAGEHMFKDGIKFDDAPGQQKVTYFAQGVWTPTLFGTTTSPTSVVYSERHGRWTRINNVVFFSVYVRWSNATAGTGELHVDGLPFSVESANQAYTAGAVDANNIDISVVSNTLIWEVRLGATRIGIYEVQDNATITPLNAANQGGAVTRYLLFSGFYYTTAS
jgi:hypothetical protein